MKQNITLRLDQELLRKARVLAARRSTSVSAMLGQELCRLVNEDEARERARRQALDHLKSGLRLGGTPAKRDELHER